MALKLTLAKRAAQIGPSINTRTEKHGEEDVPGLDIPLSGIMLTREELCVVLQDEAAFDSLFTTSRGSQHEPRFQNIKALQMDSKLEDAKVTLVLDDDAPLIFKPAKISKITLEPQIGGLTAMSCTVQGNPSDHLDVIGMLNSKCRVTILNAKMGEKPEGEPELPMEHKDQAERKPKGKNRTRADLDG